MPRHYRLREVRERKFISQDDLSQTTGIAASTISRIESGLQAPRWVTIRKLAEALGVEPDELIDWNASTADPEKAKTAA